jgi:hypothetical protein
MTQARQAEALEAASTAATLLGEQASRTADGALKVALNQAVLGRTLAAAGRTPESRAAWEAGLAIVERYDADIDRMQFRPVAAELLILLGRNEEGARELDALTRAGFRDASLDRLARDAGARRESPF